jgi:hypothetical protein
MKLESMKNLKEKYETEEMKKWFSQKKLWK